MNRMPGVGVRAKTIMGEEVSEFVIRESVDGNETLSLLHVDDLVQVVTSKRDEFGNTITKEKCGYLKYQDGSGLLNVEEFDEFIYDLTNFLTYVGEPSRAERERMGVYAIIFFIIFTFLSALLYREYQKDYH